MKHWARVTKSNPCPICGKPDFCTVSVESPHIAKCTRIAEGAYKSAEDGAGMAYFHKLREPLATVPTPADAPPEIDAKKLARQCWQLCSAGMRGQEAENLGVAPDALLRLRLGWSPDNHAMTFPMRDDQDNIIGIRLRNTEGKKWAVPGSKNGLFIPRLLTGAEPLFVVEGPTDCAALLTLGIDVIGRPSDTAGTDLLVWWIKAHQYRHIVIALENNEPGSTADVNARRGAGDLRSRLLQLESIDTATVMFTTQAKDVREWLRKGARKHDVLAAAREAAKQQNTPASARAGAGDST